MISFEDNTSAGALDISYVKGVEDEIGLVFPYPYIEFMRKNNGGIPHERYFEMGSNTKVIERFLSFVPDYKNGGLGYFDVAVIWGQIADRLNSNLCPFAELFAGDYLCFDFEGNENGRVVLWDHELSDEDSPFVVQVSPSFDDFLKLLHK